MLPLVNMAWKTWINPILKSQIQQMLELFTCVYHDVVSASYSADERVRDLTTVKSRLSHEGLSFLTKTLPSLGKAIDRSLSQGHPLQAPSFAKKKGSQLPSFLGGLFADVFDCSGVLKDAGCSDTADLSRERQGAALNALRQLCFLFYKLETPFTNEQVEHVLSNFVSCDHGLPDGFDHLDSYHSADLRLARNLIHEILSSADPKSGLPRHGPGAVATGETVLEKHHFKRLYTRLNAEFPYDEWFFYNASHLCDELSSLQAMEVLESGTAKVVLVPKDSRGPRLISCEPLEYQWIQQSLMMTIVNHLEAHPYTSGQVNFADQTVNQKLALLGSVTGEYDTLDLAEASDRVSLALVKELVPDNWYRALYASRTPRTMLPNGTVVHMKKFAPMGSAVCFPIEALIFYALSVAAQINRCGMSRSDALRSTYVYGDDIVLRHGNHVAIDQLFTAVGLKLNRDKCCVGTRFKESCGVDAFDGKNVTPLRWRSTSPVICAQDLATFVAFSNAAWKRGWFRTAHTLERAVRRRYFVPTFEHDRPGCIGFVRPELRDRAENPKRKMRFNTHLHRMEVLGPRILPVEKSARKDGWELMLRSEVIRLRARTSERSTAVARFSGNYPLTYRYNLKYVWTPLAS